MSSDALKIKRSSIQYDDQVAGMFRGTIEFLKTARRITQVFFGQAGTGHRPLPFLSKPCSAASSLSTV